MATETSTKTRRSRTSSAPKENVPVEAEQVASVETQQAPRKRPPVPKKVDPHQIVVVKNGFNGTLTYVSGRTGEVWEWDSFGSEQEMELSELRNAKNTSKQFFQKNWFMFDEDWIIDYLGVGAYYRNAIGIDEFDSVFEKPADQVIEIIRGLSDGQMKTMAYRARQLIADGKIDSLKVIEALEQCLNIELIER